MAQLIEQISIDLTVTGTFSLTIAAEEFLDLRTGKTGGILTYRSTEKPAVARTFQLVTLGQKVAETWVYIASLYLDRTVRLATGTVPAQVHLFEVI